MSSKLLGVRWLSSTLSLCLLGCSGTQSFDSDEDALGRSVADDSARQDSGDAGFTANDDIEFTSVDDVADDDPSGDERADAAGIENPPVTPVELAVGGVHTCVLLEGETVRCWGGLATDGTSEDIYGGPVDAVLAPEFDFGEPVAQLVSGRFHACAMLLDGQIHCWGESRSRQLGYPHDMHIGDDESPAATDPVALDGPAVQLAAGEEHTCALLKNGTTQCWGDNSDCPLGDRTDCDWVCDPHQVQSAPAGERVARLYAGEDSTCTVLKDGQLYCWGDAIAGNCAPTHLEFDEPVVEPALGRRHFCALLASGNVQCWGRNTASGGQLGTPSATTSQHPTLGTVADASLPNVNVGGAVVQIVGGQNHTCVLLDTQQVRCWGANEHGQLGYGHTENIGDDEDPAEAGDVNVGGPVIRIAAYEDHTCALLEDSSVVCWGRNDSGQLGYGHTEQIGDNETPAEAGSVPYR